MASAPPGDAVLLTIDLEDWHQIIHRDLGDPSWDRTGIAFPRQVDRVLGLLDELGVRATFFVLGMTAERFPDELRRIAAAGHPIASHGHAHHPVRFQSEGVFVEDLRRSVDVIGNLTGHRPKGYRAPAFSITRGDTWLFDTLVAEGFTYDSSIHDSPRVFDRIRPPYEGPFTLTTARGSSLTELPVAVTHAPLTHTSLPVGGGTYWRLAPWPLVRWGLDRLCAAGDTPTLYLHPYEFDPVDLRVDMTPRPGVAAVVEARYNLRRARVVEQLARVAARYAITSCEDYLEHHRPARSAAFSSAGEHLRSPV
jgi:polysaccharide deacetylase family protein (PEP-CTERM system associated)